MIWSDAILRFKKHNPNRSDWKLALFSLITWMHALNAWIIFLWLKYFDIYNIPLVDIDLFYGEMLDEFLAFTIVFALPFGLLNYFLIFFNNRYEKITKKYANKKFRYAIVYSLTMTLGAFISAIIYGILT